MNEIYTGKSKSATLPPIQIQAPSMTSVLDMLNIINGILFVQINPRDIENLKVEFEKRQQTPDDTTTSATITEKCNDDQDQKELEEKFEKISTEEKSESVPPEDTSTTVA